MYKFIQLLSLPILSILWQTNIYAQVDPVEEQSIERMTERSGDAETQDDSFLQEIAYLADHPLNLNLADESELLQLRLLHETQIRSLLHYRHALGPLIDLYELQAVPGWTVSIIKKILPYITLQMPVNVKDQFKERLVNGNHSVLIRYTRLIELSRGFIKEPGQTNAAFTGNPDKWFLRYQYQYKNLLQFGVLGEKDPGEAWFKGPQKKGFDFYSFHVYMRQLGLLKELAIGDFTVNMGQGLIEWQGLSFGKGGDVAVIKKQSEIIRPYRSSGEYNFHRGIGLSLARRNWSFTGFFSSEKRDANLLRSDSTSENPGAFTSFINTGLHRTSAELSDRGSVRQMAFGLNLKKTWRNGHVGFNLIRYLFSRKLQKSNEPYNLFAMSGNHWQNMGIDFGYTFRQFHFFGEAATSQAKGRAVLLGSLLSLGGQTDIGIVYRNISSNYQSVNGSAFTERSNPGNEKGFYASLSVRPAYRWEMLAYADRFRFPWLQYGVGSPSVGREYGCKIIFKPNRQDEIYIRFRYELKEENLPATTSSTYIMGDRAALGWRMHVSCRLDNRFSIRSRLELTRVRKAQMPVSHGFLVYTDLFYKPLFSRLKANIRLLHADIDDYDSRIYAYENDVLYQVSVPVFSGQTSKAYVNVEYKLTRSISCWLKVGRQFYSNKTLIGSGLDELKGNRKTEVKWQCLYRL